MNYQTRTRSNSKVFTGAAEVVTAALAYAAVGSANVISLLRSKFDD